MPNSVDFTTTLAHHDAAIQHLGGRMTGVETGLRTLQGEVHTGFSAIQASMNTQIGLVSSKLDKIDAAPKFDFHKMVGTIVSLAALFGIVCGGIIYITNSQSAAINARQELLNDQRTKQIDEIKERVRDLESWRPVIKKD